MKQELIKKQRADKEKDDAEKSENNSPRERTPVSTIGMKLSEKSEEIQLKMDKLKADILRNQAAKEEDDMNNNSNNSKGKEQKISRTKSFSDDSSSSSEDEEEVKKVEVKGKVEMKEKEEMKAKGEVKDKDLESVEDYDSDTQNEIDERNFNQKILDKNKKMNNNVNTIVSTSANTGINMNKKINVASGNRGISSNRGSISSDVLAFDDNSLERSLDSINAFDSASHDHIDEDLDRLDFMSQSSGSVTDTKEKGKSFFGRMTKIMKNVGKKSEDSDTSSPKTVKGGSSGTFMPYRRSRAGSKSSLGSRDSDTDSLHLEKHGRKTPDKAGSSFFSRLSGKKIDDKKTTSKDISPVAERNIDDSFEDGSL